MVDLHAHILPGLDDGAQTMQDTLEMLRIAVSCETNHIVASSHGNYFDYSLQDYRETLHRVREAVKEEGIPIKIFSGMEIFMDRDALPLLQKKELLTLNQTDYVLVEFPFEEDPSYVTKSLLELKRNGYRAVLAHPERYVFMQENPDLAYFLYEQEIVLQANTGSVTGLFGKKAQQFVLQCMDEGIIGVLGSDTHESRVRTPDLKTAAEYLKRKYSSYEVRLWLSENPSRILKGLPTIGIRERGVNL